MTTAVHTPSRKCYLRGCRQKACIAVSTRYTKQLRLEHSRGQYRMTDATPARQHIKRLMAARWTQRQIAEVSGVPAASIHQIYVGAQEKTANWRAASILAVELGTPPADPQRVSATGSRRRLQALRILGHRRYDLANRLDTTADRIKHITSGATRHVSPTEATAIAHLYRRLSTIPGPSKQTASIARNKGWHGPLAWDDIDNPKARPLTGGKDNSGKGRRRKVQADPARVARLTAEGLSAEQIAQQIGCHKRTVVRARSKMRAGEQPSITQRGGRADCQTLAERFWAKTRIAVDCECRLCVTTTDAAAKCIVWTASGKGNGYGGFWDGERLLGAHRASYQLVNGAIPEGMQLDHLCRVRRCVAPVHLEPVTQQENIRRGLRGVLGGSPKQAPDRAPKRTSVRLPANATHCNLGHELTPENTYVAPKTPGSPYSDRRCRTCKNEGKRRSRARVRARAAS